jgi:uncharacterized protein (DUF2267 family)
MGILDKLFGAKKNEPDSFRVELPMPIRYSNKPKLPTEGFYPNAVLTLRPGMSEAQAEAHLKSAGAKMDIKEIFRSPQSGAVTMVMDRDRVIRRLFYTVRIKDSVVIENVRLHSSLAEARLALPELEPDQEAEAVAAKFPLKIDASYFKARKGDIEIGLVVRADRIHGISLQTAGWKDESATS